MRPLSAGKMAPESSFARDLIAFLSALLIFDLGGLLLRTIFTTSLLRLTAWLLSFSRLQPCSVAAIISVTGILDGVTLKFKPFIRTDRSLTVRERFERFFTDSSWLILVSSPLVADNLVSCVL